MARQTRAGAALTRARVIEAAIEVVSERGIRAATLADVAARAGVTRGAVYGHFPGKPALVAAIIDGLLWPLDIGDDLAGYRAHPLAAAAVARPAVRPVDAVLANPGATACRDARASGVRLPGVPGGGG